MRYTHCKFIKTAKRCFALPLSPYSCTDKRENYSLSKSFASTGIGFAIEEGLLRTDDRIVDLFPDKLPDTVDDHLAACVFLMFFP